ncbi:MAG: 50S ribosomal protein L5 [Candidatus Absconditabacterales bacterium]|nr:50S ribosomal protein L5 [Candidatus Absconditabacterales bacterium]
MNIQKEMGLANIHQVPRILSVVVAMGIGSLASRKGVKDFSQLEKNLHTITGQRPYYIYSKKAVSNFKLREGMHSMLKVTLRGYKALAFLMKIQKIVLLRNRDFVGLSKKSFDGRGGYSFGLKSITGFPELHPDDVQLDPGMQVTISTSSPNPGVTQKFLEHLGFIFS